ncbi:MAG: hypothetical protein DRG40_00675 [Deltaproteobacteria bacterium]|nr:MAG: hypothetical protein DRG40_00675 [Deltaproteobacteria bacterium]
MVGEGSEVIERKRLVETVKQMLGAPYRFDGEDPKSGFNCLSYLYWFYRSLGVEVPDRFRSLSRENYLAYYREAPGRAKLTMLRYLMGLGKRSDPEHKRPGDLVLMEGDEVFNAIYLGGGKYLTCDTRVGIVVVPQKGLTAKRQVVIRLCPS